MGSVELATEAGETMTLKELIKTATSEQKKAYGQLCAKGRKEDADKKALNGELLSLLAEILEANALETKPQRYLGEFWKQLLGGKKKKQAPKAVELEPLTRKLPYPLGYKLREFLVEHRRYEEREAFSNFPYLLASLNSLLLRFLALICIAEYVETLEANDPEINRDLKARLQTPSDGIWKQIFEAITSRHKKDKRAFWIQKVTALLKQKQTIRGVKKGKSTTALLQELIEFRNKLLHEPQQFTLYSKEIEEVANKLKAVCASLVAFEGSRLLVREQETLIQYVGNSPEAVKTEGEEGMKLPPRKVWLSLDADPSKALNLHPLLCHTSVLEGQQSMYEMYFLNGWHAAGEQLEYISFGNPQSFNHVELSLPYSDFEGFLRRMHLVSLPPARLRFYRTTKLHSQHFVGREGPLESLREYLREVPRPYGLMFGGPAMGKTALLSVLHDETEKGAWPDHLHVLWHFCDPTENRTHPILFLRSVLAQIDECTAEVKKDYPSELEELKEAFQQRLQQLGEQLKADERMVLVIDGLDEAVESTGGLPSIPSLLPAVSLLPPQMGILVSYRMDERGQNDRIQEHLSRVSSREERYAVPGCSPLAGLVQAEMEWMVHDALPHEELTEEVMESLWKTVSGEDARTASPSVLRFLSQGLREGSIQLNRPESLPRDQTELYERFWHELPAGGDYLIQRLLGILAFLPEHGDDDLFSRIFSHIHQRRGRPFTREDIAERRSVLNKQLLFSGDQYRLVHSSFRQFVRSRFRPQEQGQLLLDVLRADKPERLRELANQGDCDTILSVAPRGDQSYRRFQYLSIGAMWVKQSGHSPELLLEALARLTHQPLNPSALELMQGVLERAGAARSIVELLVEESAEDQRSVVAAFEEVEAPCTGSLSVDEMVDSLHGADATAP